MERMPADPTSTDLRGQATAALDDARAALSDPSLDARAAAIEVLRCVRLAEQAMTELLRST